jgi:hypothetical protein
VGGGAHSVDLVGICARLEQQLDGLELVPPHGIGERRGLVGALPRRAGAIDVTSAIDHLAQAPQVSLVRGIPEAKLIVARRRLDGHCRPRMRVVAAQRRVQPARGGGAGGEAACSLKSTVLDGRREPEVHRGLGCVWLWGNPPRVAQSSSSGSMKEHSRSFCRECSALGSLFPPWRRRRTAVARAKYGPMRCLKACPMLHPHCGVPPGLCQPLLCLRPTTLLMT